MGATTRTEGMHARRHSAVIQLFPPIYQEYNIIFYGFYFAVRAREPHPYIPRSATRLRQNDEETSEISTACCIDTK